MRLMRARFPLFSFGLRVLFLDLTLEALQLPYSGNLVITLFTDILRTAHLWVFSNDSDQIRQKLGFTFHFDARRFNREVFLACHKLPSTYRAPSAIRLPARSW